MNLKKIRWLLAGVTILALIAGGIVRFSGPTDERTPLAGLAPGVRFAEKTGEPPLYRSDQGLIAFNSYDIVPEVRGYAGPIKVLVSLRPDGVIAGVKILEHGETKNYVHYMEERGYLEQFAGKSITSGFMVDKDIDGISRATVSVEALAATVRESSRRAAAAAFGLQVPEAVPAAQGRGWLLIAALFLIAGAVYVVTGRRKSFDRWRDVVLAAGILVVGAVLSAPFSILHLYNLLLLKPSSSVALMTMVVGVCLSLIAAGRFYCGWICPFGALAEFIGRLRVRKWVVAPEQERRLRMLKYGLLGIATAAALTGGKAEYGNYEAYVTLFSLHGSAIGWAVTALSLAANPWIPRFWCRYLCPVAAFAGLFTRTTAGYPSVPECPMANAPSPEGAECIRCNRCRTGRR